MKQQQSLCLCMTLSITMLLSTNTHAQGEAFTAALHGASSSGEVFDAFGDIFENLDKIVESTQKHVTVHIEQPNIYYRCRHTMRQWVLSAVCRYYQAKEYYTQIHYWLLRRFVAQQYALLQHEVGLITGA